MNLFKRTLEITGLVALVSLLGLPAFAQVPNLLQPDVGFSTWSGGTTNGNTALSWVIVPARSANGGTPAITYLNASSDLSFAAITNYYCTAKTVANFTNTTTSLPTSGTNGFGSGDYIVIRHILTENYEKRVLTTATSATNVTVTVAPLEPVVPGDQIFRYQGLGAAAITFNAAGTNISLTAAGGTDPIFSGQKGIPMLIEVNATTKGSIYAVTARWIP